MRKLMIYILVMTLTSNLHCENLKPDSIYCDLSLFLVSRKIIDKEYISDFSDNYSSLIYIREIIEEDSLSKKIDFTKDFGIYKFNYVGLMDGGFFFLIKNGNKYSIYLPNDIPWIIDELFIIKEESNLLPNDLFVKYIKELIKPDYDYERYFIPHQIGNIIYKECKMYP